MYAGWLRRVVCGLGALSAPLLVLLLLGSWASAGQGNVLVVQSYSRDLAWTRQCDRGIAEALADKASIVTVYLDTKPTPPEEHVRKADEALDLFRRLSPDVVLLGDDNALRLLGPAVARTGTPVIYFGINNNPRNYFEYLPDNVGGLIERISLLQWIRLIGEIMPSAENFLVLMDGSPTADAIASTVFKGETTLAYHRLAVTLRSTGRWEEWRRIVEKGGFDAVVMPVFHALKDASGRHVPYGEVVAWTSRHSAVPVFATQDYAVGDDGVVGAYVVYGEKHGYLAGSMAARLLDGERMQDISAQGDQPGVFVFNERQLNRFGLVLPKSIREQSAFR